MLSASLVVCTSGDLSAYRRESGKRTPSGYTVATPDATYPLAHCLGYDASMNEPTPHPTPSDHVTTVTTQVAVPVATAAARLGVSSDALRARIRRGTMQGEKRNGNWYVYVPVATLPDDVTMRHDATAHVATLGETIVTPVATQPTGGPDLAPLADLIEDLTTQVRDLSAAAAMWQTRSHFFEERLKQLEAGTVTQAPQSVPNESRVETYRASADTNSEGFLDRLRRWLRGNP